MTKILKLCILILLVNLFPIYSFAAEKAIPLQSLIDQTEVGGTLHLQSGTYIGPVSITKPITITGDGKATLYGSGDSTLVTIQADHVHLSKIHVIDERMDPKLETISVQGNQNVIENLDIVTNGIGIKLYEAMENQIIGNQIIRDKQSDLQSVGKYIVKGNGIDLWGSHDNQIFENHILNMQDGIYLESSEDNRIEHNLIEDSRYAIHLMFTKHTIVSDNQGIKNITGIMVMSTEGTQVLHNQFLKQNQNVNAQGLLLFNVRKAIIKENVIDGNRVGLYIEASYENEISQNLIKQNYIGMQLIEAEDNQISHNDFIANVVQAQSEKSTNNQIELNYWDDLEGIDLTNDGQSDMSYKVNPYFFTLANSVSPFLLFFHSPGMGFLEELFAEPESGTLKDPMPMMSPNFRSDVVQSGNTTMTLWLSIFLFIFSLTIISLGVVKR